jgi:hypothetical protein
MKRSLVYDNIPIVIFKYYHGDKKIGWIVEVADNYESYKPTKSDKINFEDISFHFSHPFLTFSDDIFSYIFYTKKDAVSTARFCNKTYLNNKGKILYL